MQVAGGTGVGGGGGESSRRERGHALFRVVLVSAEISGSPVMLDLSYQLISLLIPSLLRDPLAAGSIALHATHTSYLLLLVVHSGTRRRRWPLVSQWSQCENSAGVTQRWENIYG